MTFPIDKHGLCVASPYYWCDKHDPWEKNGISQKIQINMDAVSLFRKESGQPFLEEQRRMNKLILRAIGIKKGTRITEKFALDFFASLENEKANN